MNDSLLTEALEDTRALLEELDEDDDDAGARTLRERVALLDRASAALELGTTRPAEVVSLVRAALHVRDEAMELRRRHRSMHELIHRMMD
jgi:hypothetical protein